jgi:hypothetical protein
MYNLTWIRVDIVEVHFSGIFGLGDAEVMESGSESIIKKGLVICISSDIEG